MQYLKSNLDIMAFKVYLFDRDTIKVIDKNEEVAYFKFDDNKKEIEFKEEVKEQDYEISL